MNNGAINSFSINGAAVPNWIVRAVGVVAVAAATVTATPTRYATASAYGDAVAQVSLAPTQTIVARATATAGVSSYLAPHIIYAGKSTATALATGNGSIRRDVFAQAAGDAHATGEALTAQALGNASVSMGSTVVLCKPHIVFFGKSNVIGLASTVSGSGKVTRYCTASTTAGIGYTRGEASIKLSGNSYYNRDGFVPLATSGCVASVPQDRIKIIATLGSFTFAESDGTVKSFIRYTARSNGSGQSTAQTVNSRRILKGAGSTTAQASATITGTRVALGKVSEQASASYLSIRSRIKYAATGRSDANATSIAVVGKRSAMGIVTGFAGADSGYPIVGKQNKATASSTAIATLTFVATRIKYAAQSTGNSAQASVVSAKAVLKQMALATSTALASVGKAYAVSNSDISAPADRYMVIDAQSREMTAPFEDRTMTVTA